MIHKRLRLLHRRFLGTARTRLGASKTSYLLAVSRQVSISVSYLDDSVISDLGEEEALLRDVIPERIDRAKTNTSVPLHTVIGHTEGTAGIAGLLKASLAVQHGIIPPNMMFDRLSPRVAPFYKRLRIVTEATPWPAVAPGQPRRASVNSFGKRHLRSHISSLRWTMY